MTDILAFHIDATKRTLSAEISSLGWKSVPGRFDVNTPTEKVMTFSEMYPHYSPEGEIDYWQYMDCSEPSWTAIIFND